MRGHFAFILSFAAVAALLVTTMPAQAASAISDELQVDIDSMAAVKGISFDEALNRYNMRQQSSAVVDAIGHDKQNFGGIWQDDSNGRWRMHVMVTNLSAINSHAIASAMPDNVPFEWQQVKYNYATLEAIQLELIDLGNTIVGASRFSSISVDVPGNRVVVAFPAADPELQAQISAKYGEPVEFVIEPPGEAVSCNDTNDPEGGSRYNCTYWRGGIMLQKIKGDNGAKCTMTMWAKKNSTTKGIVSAGHCGNANPSDPYHKFWHNSVLVGTESINSTRGNGLLGNLYRSDSLFIPTTQAGVSYNKIYETPSSKAYSITSDKSWVQQIVGDWVCKHGVGTDWLGLGFGRDCGTITNYSTIWNANGRNVPVKAGSMNLLGGDSGAPMAYKGHLFGLGVANGPSRWSITDDVEADLGVTFCMTATC